MMSGKRGCKYEEEMELRRGPWTLEEDTLLIHYIACHGEGRWNLLARCSGLKRTGKSCRLRWLNYLKPDVKRGNLTPEEQILILELHSKWGNRWSRIAQHLPGRTDNEIKNFWRTRVQKQARQLKIDANSISFRDAVRCFWLPRLVEKMGSTPPPASLIQLPPQGPQPEITLDDPGYYRAPADAAAPVQYCQEPRNGSLFAETQSFDYAIYSQLLSGDVLSGTYLDCLEAMPAAAVGSTSTSDCSMMENNSVDDMASGLWNMDELWQVRKLHEWGI